MFFKNLISIAALSAMALPAAAMAQAGQASERPISLSSQIQLVSVSEVAGTVSEELVSPEKVIPGDALQFTTSFRNNTAEMVTNFTVVNPVPTNMVLSDSSAAENDVSVDGGQNFGMIADLMITDETGASRAATPADVTHLRWVVPNLPAGEEGSVQYRASVR